MTRKRTRHNELGYRHDVYGMSPGYLVEPPYRRMIVQRGDLDLPRSDPPRSPQSDPYAFDPFTIWGTAAADPRCNATDMTDELHVANYEKYDALAKKHYESGTSQYRRPFEDGACRGELIEAFLRDYYADPDLVLTRVIAQCNWSSGYRTYRLDYITTKTPAERRAAQRPAARTRITDLSTSGLPEARLAAAIGRLSSPVAGLDVERDERVGQRELVHSGQLPAKGTLANEREWNAIGVTFVAGESADPLFRTAMLPPGWSIEPTDHTYWSSLIDDKGRKRASIFYKAASYDRNAHCSLTRRFNVQRDYNRDDHKTAITVNITDCGQVIHTIGPLPIVDQALVSVDSREFWDHEEARTIEANQQADKWLTERGYVDWLRCDGCWDQP